MNSLETIKALDALNDEEIGSVLTWAASSGILAGYDFVSGRQLLAILRQRILDGTIKLPEQFTPILIPLDQ